MKLTDLWRLLFLPIQLVSVQQPSAAQNVAVQPNIAAKVDEALARARYDDFALCFALLKEGDQVLPLAGKYASSPFPGTRQGVYFLVKGSHSPEALRILSKLAAHGGEQSVSEIYSKYSRIEIIKWGGPEVKRNLLRFSEMAYLGNVDPDSVKVLFLLTAFPPDKEVRQHLLDLRSNAVADAVLVYNQGVNEKRTVPRQVTLGYSNLVNVSLPLDLALSEEGDEEATAWLLQDLRHGDIDGTLAFIIGSARFIRNRLVLEEMVGLVKDVRPTRVYYRVGISAKSTLSADGKPATATAAAPQEETLRVCDLAVAALAQNVGTDVGIPDLMTEVRRGPRVIPTRRYTKGELDGAYLALNKALALDAPIPGGPPKVL